MNLIKFSPKPIITINHLTIILFLYFLNLYYSKINFNTDFSVFYLKFFFYCPSEEDLHLLNQLKKKKGFYSICIKIKILVINFKILLHVPHKYCTIIVNESRLFDHGIN